ncbi:MAG: lmo0937 family membrane protein [Fimbriimonas sp.]|nr:lmo0937 family membrane protein [Fimbriimonas sp.]
MQTEKGGLPGFGAIRLPSSWAPFGRGDANGLGQENSMLELIIIILVILWFLGYFVISMGSFIHILLILAVIAVVVRIFRGSGRTI